MIYRVINILNSNTYIQTKRLQFRVGILFGHALSTLAERYDRVVVPPLSEVAVFVVLTTFDRNLHITEINARLIPQILS